MSSPASALPSATTSSRGSRQADSARTMARSSSRAIASQVRPGPNRSRPGRDDRLARHRAQRGPGVALGDPELRLVDAPFGGRDGGPELAHRPMST